MVAERLKSLVADAFYKHGQFCSAHPWPVITFVCAVILIASYPIVNLPLPGTAPMEFSSPIQGFRVPLQRSKGPIQDPGVEGIVAPRWFSGPPVGFIQQFVINATVSPWKRGLIPEDAFRAPLSKAFDLRQDIEEYQTSAGKSVRSFCLYVMEPEDDCKDTLPRHNCLMVSPANVWGDSANKFQQDAKLVNSIFEKQGSMEATPSIKDLLFGIPSKYTGISRFYIRSRQRQISFAITLVLQTYNQTFVEGLKEHLLRRHGDGNIQQDTKEKEQIVHIYYQDEKGLIEMSPLVIIYVLLLLYIYFSISTIEMVQSKWGLAFAAVIMIMSSLSMSVGICLMFGLTPSLSGSEVFPYLVIIIGLENILVFTKSVVSTPVHLAVNIRIAQGLSKEGWSITKNLCAELLVVLIAFFTLVPAIQEFCVFALVGLMTDFFLQMFYFVPVLSVDIRRMELSDLSRNSVRQELAASARLEAERPPTPTQGRHMTRSKSAPRSLNKMSYVSTHSQPGYNYPGSSRRLATLPLHTTRSRVPRRLKFIYFWASTRLMQRLIMAASIVWIILTSMFMYKSGLVTHLTDTRLNQSTPMELHEILTLQNEPSKLPLEAPPLEKGTVDPVQHAVEGVPSDTDSRKKSRMQAIADQLMSLTEGSSSWAWQQESVRRAGQQGDLWRKLSLWHWPTLFGCYNISLHGKYISILPPSYMNININPEDAVALRHKQERERAAKWYSSLDPDSRVLPYDPDFYTEWIDEQGVVHMVPLYQASPLDYYMTMTLGILSGASSVILVILLFKCAVLVRLRRARYKRGKHEDILKRVVMKKSCESVPWVLMGHQQEIECLSSEGAWIASCCLGGEIRIWDGSSGECTICIDRHSYFKRRRRLGSSSARTRHGSGGGEAFLRSVTDFSIKEKSNTYPLSRRNGYSQNQVDLSGAICTDFGSSRSSVEVGSSCQDDRLSSGVYSGSVGSQSMEQDLSSCSGTPRSSGNGYDFRTLVDAYLMQEQHRYGNSLVEDEDDEGLDDVYPDLPSPPIMHRSGSQNITTINEFRGSFRGRTASTGSMGLRFESSQSPREPVSRSPTPYASRNRFSFDEELLRQCGAGGDAGMTSPLDGVLPPPIWCLVCSDHMVVVGCSNGRIEMWDSGSGFLLGSYEDNPIGATGLTITGTHLVVARLNGSLDFLDLVTHHSIHLNQAMVSDFLASDHRGKMRSFSISEFVPLGGAIFCSKQASVQAHQQPINDVQVARDQVVTASQDHTLKVFRLEDSLCTYTLRGHTGSVTTLYVDKNNSYQIASGSDDGMVRLWDTLTGVCLHSLWGHVSTVLSVTLSRDHVISVGMDNRLCVWKRRRGRMIHVIQLDPGCTGTVATLSNNHMVTGGQGYLAVWDIFHGEPIRVVELGGGEQAVRQIVVTDQGRAVVCDYGRELRLVTFPSELKKTD
ncbi:sterol regulatory element-binding protein cleavage-activating protein-like [Acanthaster planci]|uniref:Sterol regulatory element-binding protein cleavage-activating protein n=1 Tax=Acanthaster planci TaxID=133434 RepID=A0A8B7XIC7_ACAPL|nr:sterol regulatory element-binding protein cleavage-activating protein-like [Acanthaster planci]